MIFGDISENVARVYGDNPLLSGSPETARQCQVRENRLESAKLVVSDPLNLTKPTKITYFTQRTGTSPFFHR